MLKEWVKSKGGPVAVSEKLGVTPAAVRSWLRCESTPRPKIMVEIMRLSKGRVTLVAIVKETGMAKRNKANVKRG